jgi:hypothetical protein
MTKEYLVNACPNPLCFFEADDAWSRLLKANVTADHVIKYACAPDESTEIAEIVERYRRISTKSADILAAPAETKILQKLIWPLRHAKTAYMLGNYLGTIAMCGLVAEMVAILLYEISDFGINSRKLGQKEQEAMFGRSFEKLGQDRRVDVLSACGVIDGVMKTNFDVVRTKRKRYLHLWSEKHEQLPKDAVAVYNATVSLVAKVLGQDFRNGKLLLNPALVAYLRRAGVLEDREPEGHVES